MKFSAALAIVLTFAVSSAFADHKKGHKKVEGHDKEHAHVAGEKTDHEHKDEHHKAHDHKAHHPDHADEPETEVKK